MIALNTSPIRLVPFAIALLVGGFLAPPRAVAVPPTLPSFRVEPEYFNPVGDPPKDVVRIYYTLGGDTAQVRAEVQTGTKNEPTGGLVRVLLDDVEQIPGAYVLEWDGTDLSGSLAQDGFYWLVLQATNAEGSAEPGQDNTYLDTVVPQVSNVTVNNPYTPDIPGRDSLARVSMVLSGIGNSDQVQLTLSGPPPDPIVVMESVFTDGPHTTTWNGSTYPDGLYELKVKVFDQADNESEVQASDLNLDITPPQGFITTPASVDTNDYIRRIEGYVKDRSGLQSAVVTVFHAADSSKAVVDSLPCPCIPDSIPFTLDLPDSVADTDSLIVDLFLVDLPGHVGGSSALFLVDTIPPPPPIFDALPASVLRPQLAYSGTATDADSVYIFLNGFVVNAHLVRNDGFSGSVTLGQGNNTLQGRAHDAAHNASGFSPGVLVSYDPAVGIIVPERFRQGDVIQINLDSPADAVTIHILNLRGRKIRTFQDNSSNSFYDFPWDLADDDGNAVGSGPYAFRVIIDMGEGVSIEESVIAVVTR